MNFWYPGGVYFLKKYYRPFESGTCDQNFRCFTDQNGPQGVTTHENEF